MGGKQRKQWHIQCMDPREDPEDRIRELERPLADGPYEAGPAYQPSPSPLGYGTPFPGPPPKPPSGNRVWWILGAIIAVGIVALAGVIALGVARKLNEAGQITVSPSTTTSRVAS